MNKVYPVLKTPKTKLYCYHRAFCSECGSIHLYRKVEIKDEAIFMCSPQFQTSLLAEERAIQLGLFINSGSTQERRCL